MDADMYMLNNRLHDFPLLFTAEGHLRSNSIKRDGMRSYLVWCEMCMSSDINANKCMSTSTY